MEQVRKHQTRRACSDNSNLRAQGFLALPKRFRTRRSVFRRSALCPRGQNVEGLFVRDGAKDGDSEVSKERRAFIKLQPAHATVLR